MRRPPPRLSRTDTLCPYATRFRSSRQWSSTAPARRCGTDVRAAWLISLNDLRQNVRSKSIFIIGFVAPLTLAFILNLVFGDLDEPDGGLTFDVGLAIVDDGPTGQGLASVVEEVSAGGLVEVKRFDDADAARAAVDGSAENTYDHKKLMRIS